MAEKKGFTSIKVRGAVYSELLELQNVLSMTGLANLPESVRPESLGLGEIIAAALRALRKQLKRRK